MVLNENMDKLKWITFTVQEVVHDTASELNMIHELLSYCYSSIDMEVFGDKRGPIRKSESC